MSKRRRLFICLVLRFKNGHKPVFLPITSAFYIIRLLSLRCLGSCTRVFHMLHPCIVPETLIQRLDTPKTLGEPLTSYHRRLRELKRPGYCVMVYVSSIGSVGG